MFTVWIKKRSDIEQLQHRTGKSSSRDEARACASSLEACFVSPHYNHFVVVDDLLPTKYNELFRYDSSCAYVKAFYNDKYKNYCEMWS